MFLKSQSAAQLRQRVNRTAINAVTRAANSAFTTNQVRPLQRLFVSILKLLKCTQVFIYPTDTVQTAVYQNVTLASGRPNLAFQALGAHRPSAEYSVVLSACISLSRP